MTQGHAKIRLFVDAPLAAGAQVVPGPEQAHYLLSVMRLGVGGRLRLFNGRDGEWEAEIATASRRSLRLIVRARTRSQCAPPDLWLLFAPVKKTRTDFIVEKATELGCRLIRPVLTRHTASQRVKVARLEAHAIEAAEQCGRLTVPHIAAPASLDVALAEWDAGRRLYFCDESGTAAPMLEALATGRPGPAAVLVGPEGGFAEGERAQLAALPFARPVSLGPRILRTETAALAALSLWQAAHGDWR